MYIIEEPLTYTLIKKQNLGNVLLEIFNRNHNFELMIDGYAVIHISMNDDGKRVFDCFEGGCALDKIEAMEQLTSEFMNYMAKDGYITDDYDDDYFINLLN